MRLKISIIIFGAIVTAAVGIVIGMLLNPYLSDMILAGVLSTVGFMGYVFWDYVIFQFSKLKK